MKIKQPKYEIGQEIFWIGRNPETNFIITTIQSAVIKRIEIQITKKCTEIIYAMHEELTERFGICLHEEEVFPTIQEAYNKAIAEKIACRLTGAIPKSPTTLGDIDPNSTWSQPQTIIQKDICSSMRKYGTKKKG